MEQGKTQGGLCFWERVYVQLLSHEGSTRQNDDPGNCIYIVVAHKPLLRKGFVMILYQGRLDRSKRI